MQDRVSYLSLVLNLDTDMLECTYSVKPGLPEDLFHRRSRRHILNVSIRNALREEAACLSNVVVTPLWARQDGKRGHDRAGLINIHEDGRVPKGETRRQHLTTRSQEVIITLMTCKIRAAKRFDPWGVMEMADRAWLP